VSTAVGDPEWDSLVSMYQEYRHDYLLPFAELSASGREFTRLRGEMRMQWFEALSEGWLKLAQRKIVVFHHGIYTITYRQDRRRPFCLPRWRGNCGLLDNHFDDMSNGC